MKAQCEMELESKYQLPQKLLALSHAKTWEKAKLEWVDINNFWWEENYCLCGHSIIENCEIVNTKNGSSAIVGNCCIKKFNKQLNSHLLFSGYRKILKDETKSLNATLINWCYVKGILNEEEREFYMSIRNKRKLTLLQLNMKIKINLRVIRFISKR